jgi:hypothetical protein
MIEKLLKTENTGIKVPVYDIDPSVSVEYGLDKIGEPEIKGFSPTYNYIMSLTLKVMFQANEPQLLSAEKRAREQFKYEIYKDIVSKIYEALNYCNNDKVSEILISILDGIK